MKATLKVDETYRSALTYKGAMNRFLNDIEEAYPFAMFTSVSVRRNQDTGEWAAKAHGVVNGNEPR